MSVGAPVGVSFASVSLVSDGAYFPTVVDLLDRAERRCHASVFIVDLNAHHDPDMKVLQVLRALQDAVWRGVEVKLLIGGSYENLAIAEACHIARDYALSVGVECRMLARAHQRGSHLKLVAVDDAVLTGSHNWSLSAFSGHVQDSLLVRSPALAAYMRGLFHQQWARTQEED